MSRLIDADALIHELKNSHYPGEPDVNAGIGIAIGKVWDAPTIEPERKNGNWVRALDGNDGHVRCDKCFKIYDWDTQAQYYDFCPNCGADMSEGDENGK